MGKRFLCLLAAAVALTLPAAPAIRQRTIAGRNCCSLDDLLTLNRFLVRQTGGTLSASGRGMVLRFERNQRRFLCNGFRVELCFPPAFDGASPYLSVLDWRKVLRPLLFPATVPSHPVRTVYLDMGHGGADPGALGAFSREKDLTLALGRKVAALLTRDGFKVVMTRNSDVLAPLARIGQLQRQSKSDLFVSIHVNSAADRTISGIETYCLTPAGAASSNGGKNKDRTHPGNRFDANNLVLAWHIHRAVLNNTAATDRGIKRARFAVLRDLNAPGVLIEVGFISNRAEEKRLNRSDYQDKIARGIVAGIVSYRRSLSKKP